METVRLTVTTGTALEVGGRALLADAMRAQGVLRDEYVSDQEKGRFITRQSLRVPLKNSLLAGVVAASFALTACSVRNIPSALVAKITGDTRDSMEKQSRKLAGKDAIDCGRVTIGASPKAATDCALKANAEGKPFRVRYDSEDLTLRSQQAL